LKPANAALLFNDRALGELTVGGHHNVGQRRVECVQRVVVVQGAQLGIEAALAIRWLRGADSLLTGKRDATLRYHAFYCGENVWWLCQQARFAEQSCWAVFISNPTRQVAIWEQRAAPPGQPVVWDYHVILVVKEGELTVWDLDTRLQCPTTLTDYLARSFPPLALASGLPSPRFRAVEASTFVAQLATDRRHMRDARGGWIKPPPPWDAPAADRGSNLDNFVDMSQPFVGTLLDRDGLSTLV